MSSAQVMIPTCTTPMLVPPLALSMTHNYTGFHDTLEVLQTFYVPLSGALEELDDFSDDSLPDDFGVHVSVGKTVSPNPSFCWPC